MAIVSTKDLQDALCTLLASVTSDADILAEHLDSSEEVEALRQARIETFAEDGVLTTNAGLVIQLRNGNKFQLSIVGGR